MDNWRTVSLHIVVTIRFISLSAQVKGSKGRGPFQRSAKELAEHAERQHRRRLKKVKFD